MTAHFGDRLCDAVGRTKTPLVVGLDPVLERLPATIRGQYSGSEQLDVPEAVDAIFDFCKQTIQIIAPMVPAVKINIAFFENYLWDGIETYYTLISEASTCGLQVIADVKRGDIGHTAQLYAASHLKDPQLSDIDDTVTADAITINGYTGVDGIKPFADMAEQQGKGVFVLVRTSNPSAAAIQDFAGTDGQTMYEKIAEIVGQIAGKPERIGKKGYSNVGMIVGGTAPEVTADLRKKYDNVWFLVPGYGSQGATAADCVRFCKPDGTGALINASRSIIYAYEKPRYKSEFGDDWKRCIEQAVIDAKMDLANAMSGR
ncbi:MAG: orotidine-5'-phosphate decarboxylase [Planctomycetota bacterium]|jgi:orotidine-5'-phosphate decarboxylase